MMRHVGLYVVRTDQECTSSECRNTGARVLVHLGIFACFAPLYPPTYRRAHLRKSWLFPRFRKRQRMVQQSLS